MFESRRGKQILKNLLYLALFMVLITFLVPMSLEEKITGTFSSTDLIDLNEDNLKDKFATKDITDLKIKIPNDEIADNHYGEPTNKPTVAITPAMKKPHTPTNFTVQYTATDPMPSPAPEPR